MQYIYKFAIGPMSQGKLPGLSKFVLDIQTIRDLPLCPEGKTRIFLAAITLSFLTLTVSAWGGTQMGKCK